MWRELIVDLVERLAAAAALVSTKADQFAIWVERALCDHDWSWGKLGRTCPKCHSVEWYDDDEET